MLSRNWMCTVTYAAERRAVGWAEKVQSDCVYTVMKPWVSSPRGERERREDGPELDF